MQSGEMSPRAITIEKDEHRYHGLLVSNRHSCSCAERHFQQLEIG